MHLFGFHRRVQQLALDAMFVALMAHFLVTGHAVPPALVDLFRDQPEIVAVSPLDAPNSAPESNPRSNESADETPDT